MLQRVDLENAWCLVRGVEIKLWCVVLRVSLCCVVHGVWCKCMLRAFTLENALIWRCPSVTYRLRCDISIPRLSYSTALWYMAACLKARLYMKYRWTLILVSSLAICRVDTKLDRSSVNNGFLAQKQHEGSVIMLVMVLFRGSSWAAIACQLPEKTFV